MTRYGHDIRQLALCDNLAAVLTLERCRFRNYKVLKILRQFAAYCFARNVRVSIRWVPFELEPDGHARCPCPLERDQRRGPERCDKELPEESPARGRWTLPPLDEAAARGYEVAGDGSPAPQSAGYKVKPDGCEESESISSEFKASREGEGRRSLRNRPKLGSTHICSEQEVTACWRRRQSQRR